MALKLLEPSIRSRLRSGVAIVTLSLCVGELTENSIDAGATCVAIRVDITKFKVQVVDNGKGISFEDLSLIGERYMTSKCHTIQDVDSNLNFFGYRGEAIASIVDVSGTVEICSRHRLSQQTYSKIFHNGKPMPVTVSKTHRPSVGTTVSVHDFFYNMPVRRKGISATLELEQVKRVVESIALVNPSVSFSMRNDSTGECVLQTHKTNSVMTRFGLLFGADKMTGMKRVSSSQAGFEISGFMSIDGHHSKSLQFIYVNGRMVRKTPLHTCVNNLLANSLISRKLSRVAESSWLRKDQGCGSELVSPRHSPDVFGIYVLQVKCPRSEYDICLEPAKTLIEFKEWDGVMSAIEMLVRDFLVEYNLTMAPVKPAALLPDSQVDQGSISPVIECEEMSAVLPGSNLVDDLSLEPLLQSRPVRCPRKPTKSLTHPACTHGRSTGLENEHTDLLQTEELENITEASKEFKNDTTGSDLENHIYSRQSLPGDLSACSNNSATVQDQDSVIYLPLHAPCDHSKLENQRSVGNEHTTVSLTDSKFSVGYSSSQLSMNPTIVACNDAAVYTTCQQHVNNSVSTADVMMESQNPLQFHSSSSFIKPHCSVTKKSTHAVETNVSKHDDTPAYTHVREIEKDFPIGITNVGSKETSAGLAPVEKSLFQYHSQAQNTSFRSPLGSASISTKLSKLFKNNPRKSGTVSNHKSLPEGRLHPTFRHPISVSHSSLYSGALRYKQSGHTSSVTSVNLPSDSVHPKLSLDNHDDRSLPLVPLTSSLQSMHTSATDDNSRAGHIDAIVQPLLTSYSTTQSGLCSKVSSIPSSMRSCFPFEGDKQRSLSPVHLATVDYQCCTLSTAVSHQNQCSALNLNHTVTTAPGGGKACIDKTLEVPSNWLVLQKLDTCIMSSNQPQNRLIVSDEYQISNCGFSSRNSITHGDMSASRGHYSNADIKSGSRVTSLSEPIMSPRIETHGTVWKEVIDPATGGVLYVHSKSGNCVSSLPRDSSVDKELDLFTSLFNKNNEFELSTKCTSPVSATGHSSADDNRELTRRTHSLNPYRQRLEDFGSQLGHHKTSSFSSDNDSFTTVSVKSGNLSISSFITGQKPQMQLTDTKWRYQSELKKVNSSISCSESDTSKSFDDILNSWKNPTFLAGEERVLGAGDGKPIQIKVHRVINQYKFTREMFSNIKVLGQVDKKFIACVLDSQNKGSHDLLVMIDQHAAHERVRLEALLEDLYETSPSSSTSSNPPQVKSSKIFPPLTIELQPNEVNLARLFREQFKHSGLSLKFDSSNKVLVASLPSVFMEREVSEIRRGRPTVALTILKLLQSTRGVASSMPEAILNVLSSQACHGAIKFGDSLTFAECQSLIRSLSQCNLPFQCAHGRPSIVPILDLHILDQRYPILEGTPFPLLGNIGHKRSKPKTSKS